MESKNYIVAIDLGDSNVIVAVGSRQTEDDLINLECIVSQPSEGVVAGKITNIESAIASISSALEQVRNEHGFEIKEIYAGISGEFVYCTGYTDHVFVPDPVNGITKDDVKALFDRMSNVQVSEERVIMERIPQNYVVDDTIDVKNPVGSFGSRLSSTFNFIISETTPIQRLEKAMQRQGIKVLRTFSDAVVMGDAVLSLDEKEEGVAVVDIGGGLTNIAVYYRNVVRYIATIPMGASAINNDIRTLMIPDRYIDPLKQRYGYAIADDAPQDVVVNVKGRTKREAKDIIIYNLATIIEARAKDIVDFVEQELKASGYFTKLPYGIVLTGGSAQLRGIDKLFRRQMDFDVRVAEAEDIISPQTRSLITSPSDSTVIGLLIQGAKRGYCQVEVQQIKKKEESKKPPIFTPPTPQSNDTKSIIPPPVATPVAPYTINNNSKVAPPPIPKKVVEQDVAAVVEPPKPIKPASTTASTPTPTREKPSRRSFMEAFNNIVSSVNNRYGEEKDEDEFL